MQNPEINPPAAEKIAHTMNLHGDVRIDHYYWLNQRENQKVLDYLNAENDYRTRSMKHTEPLQEKLFNEIKGRIREDDQSVPYKKDGYWYYVRYARGTEYPIYCRKKNSLTATEEILLDVNERAKDYDYYHIGGMSVSPDNKWLAFGEDTLSRRIYNIRFKNLETGEVLEEMIEYTTGSIAWAADSKTVFYTVKDHALRPYKIYRHLMGEESTSDVEIYHETDPTFTTTVFLTKSEDFIMIASRSSVSNEYRFLNAQEPDGEFKLIQARIPDLEYGVAHFRDHFYIRTNKDGARNFKLMKTEVTKPGMENWVDVVPHRKDVFLEGLEIFRDFLVLEERKNGLNHILIQRWDGTDSHYLPFDEETYTAGIGNNPDFNSSVLRYAYTSLTVPTSIIDYDMNSRTSEVKKQQEIIGGYDSSEYQSERIWATAADGKKVPVSLVYKKSMVKSKGGNPLLLYGYGSYGHTIDPTFSSTRLSLLDRGFIFAIAHIRGGQYLGREWYDEGKMLYKKNTFTDFISCAEKLVQSGYTSKEHLYAMGGSAGGLLVGTVVNMRPDLFRGVIAAVPFVDVVTTMLDESIPLTTGEYHEWGNPNDPEYYQYMKEYSPYDNVEAKEYPAMLVTTGLHDSQVQYWEPAKWVARLRELKTDKNPIYLYINMETGHGGASGRYEVYREVAMEYAFLLDLEGINS